MNHEFDSAPSAAVPSAPAPSAPVQNPVASRAPVDPRERYVDDPRRTAVDPVASRAPVDPRDRYVDDPRRKSVKWAAILSLVPGLGQVYVGYYQTGFQHVGVLCLTFLIASTGVFHGAEPPVVLFTIFYWLYNIVDAARRANLYNQALSGLRPMDLPDEMNPPRKIGSLAGGIGLIALGLVLFTHTMLDWSLRWLADWWPMGLVAIGAWLVYKDLMGKAAASGE